MKLTENEKSQISNGIKKLILDDGTELHFHYSNNRGRGNNNVTITHVIGGRARPQKTDGYGKCIDQTRTTAWKGNVNLSQRVLAGLV